MRTSASAMRRANNRMTAPRRTSRANTNLQDTYVVAARRSAAQRQ
jgi:hypothetical protein